MTGRRESLKPGDISFRRQSGKMQELMPLDGSRNLAHNTPSATSTRLIDKPQPKTIPAEPEMSGRAMMIERDTLRQSIKKTRKTLRDDPLGEPERKRLEKQLESQEKELLRKIRSIDEWAHYDNERRLEQLIADNDPELAAIAKQLLHMRTGRHGEKFSKEEIKLMQALADTVRDTILVRLRADQRSQKKKSHP